MSSVGELFTLNNRRGSAASSYLYSLCCSLTVQVTPRTCRPFGTAINHLSHSPIADVPHAPVEENMVKRRVSQPEAFAVFAAALAIPFYLGIVHSPVPQLLLYSGAASAAMTTGEFVETPERRRGGARIFILDMAVWFALIASVGSVVYLIALIF